MSPKSRAKIASLLVLGLGVLGGCSATPIPDSVLSSATRFANDVGSEYLTYVSNDPALDEAGKTSRIDAVLQHRALLAAYTESQP